MQYYIKEIYLGIFLEFVFMGADYHIDHLCQKTGKILENTTLCPTICYSLISPYLHYGIFGRGQCAQTHLRKLLPILQRRAMIF